MESKGLASESNPLTQKDFIPIRGWVILFFLLALPVLLVPAVWLVRDWGIHGERSTQARWNRGLDRLAKRIRELEKRLPLKRKR